MVSIVRPLGTVGLVAVLSMGGAGCSSSPASADAGMKSGTGGGQGGTAGARATGGVGGAGADGAGGKVGAGACQVRDAGLDGPGSATGQFTIVYDGTLTSCLTTCATCSGYFSSTGYGVLTLAMENSAGPPNTTTLYFQIGPGFVGATYAVDITLSENNPSFARMYQTNYHYAPGGAVNIVPGACVTFSSIDLAAGGGVSGSVDCDFMGSGVGSEQVAAHLSGTFSSLFP